MAAASSSSCISTFFLTWELALANWRKDWKQHQTVTDQLAQHFGKDTPLVACLLWNILSFVAMETTLFHYAGFSKEFERFNFCYQIVPSVIGTVSYYCYKYGTEKAIASLLSPASFLSWCQNWMAMQCIAMVGLLQSIFLYAIGIPIQAVIFPAQWNVSFSFSTDIYQDAMRMGISWMYVQLAICLVCIPLWKRGYEISMQAAGRGHVTMSYQEIAMEIIYQASNFLKASFLTTGWVVLFTSHFGFRVYAIHVVFALLEVLLMNFSVEFKFCNMHRLYHAIPALYHMTHIEHHVCKGVYPTTCGVGIWEFWASGQDNLLCAGFGLAPIPYLLFQLVYGGANIVVHTMWPHPKLLQWHTLHHTVLADVYNLNIPSPYDKKHSKWVAKLQDQLSDISPFIRHEALSDAAAFGIAFSLGLVLHYGLGVGIGTVNWSKHMSVEYLS